MKPFGAVSFCLKNPGRVVTLVLMIALTALLYVGGCYLTNIEVEALNVTDVYRDFAFVYPTNDDLDGNNLKAFLKDSGENTAIRVIPAGGNDFRYPTVFGFRNGGTAWCFTPNDFAFINERISLIPATAKFTDNTLVMSRREARFLDLSEGEDFLQNRDEACFYYGTRPYSVILSDYNAFFICLLSEEAVSANRYLVTYSTQKDKEAFISWEDSFTKQYPKLRFTTGETRRESLIKNFDVNRFIFISIIIVVTCVFFITINAVLVGIYDKRKNEFRLYAGIGIPRNKIYGKVIRELLIFSGIGMSIGFLFSIGSIAAINHFILQESGLQLYYYHSWSLCSWIICNALILFPSIALRIRFVKSTGTEDI